MKNVSLILCGGDSTRFNQNINKTLLILGNKPVFLYSLDVFISLSFDCYLVVNANDIDEFNKYKDLVKGIIIGGNSRTQSIKNALCSIDCNYDNVFIHDGARPLISTKLINELLLSQKHYDISFPYNKPVNSLKNNHSFTSIDKSNTIEVQTPEVFKYNDIKYVYNKISSNATFDDSITPTTTLLPGLKINPILNNKPNIKLTYNSDIDLVKTIMFGRDIRIGHSFDVHRLEYGGELILGGVKIKSDKGSVAHSDGDVLIHAIAESLLGSLSLGDLGKYFSDTDPLNKGISSKIILNKCKELVINAGYSIINIDSMVYLEEPKLKDYILIIRESLKDILGIDINQISVKATTYERLSEIGQGKAIGSESVCLIRRNDDN
jgi:2-C-methyl-D-erythritol 2,4-cyclodiphosphate synthase/2-C-methyl-D-erythritol 4-phosphate cytidylyltransferase